MGGLEGGGTHEGGAGRMKTPKKNGMAPPQNLTKTNCCGPCFPLFRHLWFKLNNDASRGLV